MVSLRFPRIETSSGELEQLVRVDRRWTRPRISRKDLKIGVRTQISSESVDLLLFGFCQ